MAEAELEGHWAKCGGLGKTEESGGGEGAGRLGQADAGSAADDDANDAPARSRTLPPSRGHLLRDVQRCGGSRMPAPPASHGGELVGTICQGKVTCSLKVIMMLSLLKLLREELEKTQMDDTLTEKYRALSWMVEGDNALSPCWTYLEWNSAEKKE
eukprot:s12920_g1.t1